LFFFPTEPVVVHFGAFSVKHVAMTHNVTKSLTLEVIIYFLEWSGWLW